MHKSCLRAVFEESVLTLLCARYKAKGRKQRQQVFNLIRTFKLMDLDSSGDVAQDEIQIVQLAAVQQRNPMRSQDSQEHDGEITAYLLKTQAMIEVCDVLRCFSVY